MKSQLDVHDNSELQPFQIHVPQDMLNDLHSRLAMTRWPDQEENAGWKMGTNLDYLKDLVAPLCH